MSQDKSELRDQYAHLYQTISEIDRLETSYSIRTLLEHATGHPVLEMGIGFGIVTCALAERFQEVVGVDSSSKVIDRVRRELPELCSKIYAVALYIAPSFFLAKLF